MAAAGSAIRSRHTGGIDVGAKRCRRNLAACRTALCFGGGAGRQPLGAGLKIDKLTPTRTPDGLIIEGDITNTGKTARDIPRLRVALRDVGEKEVQFKVIDPPQPRLSPGAVVHFKTPFEHPYDAATGVVVTFTAR